MGAGFINRSGPGGDEILGEKGERIRAESARAHRRQQKQRSMFAKRSRGSAWGCVICSQRAFRSCARAGAAGDTGGPAIDRLIGRPTAGYCFFPPRAGVEALPDLSAAAAAAARGQVVARGAARGGWLAAFEEATHVLAQS